MDLIRRGERSAAVADLQSRLSRLGFELPAEERGGFFGPRTEGAVKAVQQSRGLHVDGIVGEDTWRELVESSWSLGDRPLQLGEPFLRGDDVRDLQSKLNALGFNAGKHDGIFGPHTDSALRDFQRNLAIDEDGICGIETRAALDRLRLVMKVNLGPRITEREQRRANPPGLNGKRIAIDPGHGGQDPGETAVSGETEADLCFRLAARTAVLLEAEGAYVMLTRGPNDGPSESARAQIANEFGADLLLSLHLNSHPNPEARGAATYYFQHGHVGSEPGEHLAGLCQGALVDCGSVDCRSHGKAYPILRETSMPAVVVEPGFLSNPEDVGLLANSESADALAAALGRALSAYFAADSS